MTVSTHCCFAHARSAACLLCFQWFCSCFPLLVYAHMLRGSSTVEAESLHSVESVLTNGIEGHCSSSSPPPPRNVGGRTQRAVSSPGLKPALPQPPHHFPAVDTFCHEIVGKGRPERGKPAKPLRGLGAPARFCKPFPTVPRKYTA